ncbi:MAG: hypothetical protein J5613_01605 [Alphaproteobacteria bacterium]|nr:hypothetical protein [Alphaproteobacteria bacterium]MBR4806192.1 hypothetical protein [Alphaproteobacteria bacterium]
MILEKITCSDMREYNSIDDIVAVGKRWPMAEFAIQAHPSKFSSHMPRYEWFWELMQQCMNNDVNLAMHVNSQWRTMLAHGKIPAEINDILKIKRNNGKSMIGRVQININGGDEKYHFYAHKVADIIRAYPDIEFIFQYTTKQKNRARALNKTGVPFSLLYDESGGCGKSPDEWHAPVMENHKMGYSGGLSPENIADNLKNISAQLPNDYKTWIDAEGNLKDPYTKQFDIVRAVQYIQNAYFWNLHNHHSSK